MRSIPATLLLCLAPILVSHARGADSPSATPAFIVEPEGPRIDAALAALDEATALGTLPNTSLGERDAALGELRQMVADSRGLLP